MTKFELVKKHISNYDLYGLIRDGAPSDEFDSESKEISAKINKDMYAIEIAKVICEVMNNSFGRNDNHDEYIGVAMRIKEELDKVED